MKVAICISGHLRTFDQCISNIRENIFNPLRDNFETDIFLSTWNSNLDLSFNNPTKICFIKSVEIRDHGLHVHNFDTLYRYIDVCQRQIFQGLLKFKSKFLLMHF